MNPRLADRHASRTRGIVLPTVLVMLLILSVASMVIMEQISTQTRMAGNSASSSISVQVAEAMLQMAAHNLQTNKYSENQFRSNANGLYFYRASNFSPSNPVQWKTAAGWNSTPAQPVIFAGDPTTERKFMIEELPPVLSPGIGSSKPPKAYRITARVIGPGNQGSVMLQTLYKL